MSLQAISWALDESETSGTDRLVVIVMCHYTHDDGFSALSKATLAEETRLSEATIIRAQQSIASKGEIERMTAEGAPSWWLALPVNRRPAVYRMVGFLGSHYATPIRRRAARKAGVSQGSRRGVTGVNDTPSDLPVHSAISEQRTETPSAPLSQINPDADPHCVQCHGEGTYWFGGGGFDRVCPCTERESETTHV